MARMEGQRYEGVAVSLDGNDFVNCVFDRCTLEFGGSADVRLAGSTITNCRWNFIGPAARTIAFMTGLYQGGARDAMEAMLDGIRGGRSESPGATRAGPPPMP